MIRTLFSVSWIAALLACAFPACSDTASASLMPDQTRLTLERLYASPSLSGPSPRGVRFSPDGKRVTFLKPRADDLSRYDLWQFDTATGAQSMLVDSVLVDPQDAELAEAEKALRERRRIAGLRGIVDYAWGTAGTILVPAGGDLHLITLGKDKPSVRQLTNTEAFEYDAKVSPGGRYVSFIRDGALFAVEITTGKEHRLSPPAEPEKAISYGVAEFVTQEEMHRYTGYWWSGDGRHIAYTKVDESGVDIIPRFDIAADEVTVVEQRYPRAGRPNAIVSLIVRELATGKETTLTSAGPDTYLAHVYWANGAVWFQTVNRAQTHLAWNRAAGPDWRVSTPYTEENAVWVNLASNFVGLEDGGALITDESEGYRHIVWLAAGTFERRPLTSGDHVVLDILGYDTETRTVYFSGYFDTPLEKHLYAVPLGPADAENAAMRRITPEGGNWQVSLGPDLQSYVGTFSSATQPPRTGLYRIDGTLITWIEENGLDAAHPYAPYLASHAPQEFGTLTAEDNQTLHYSIRKPADFDPAKKYPVIVEVYGGPGVKRVANEWGPLTDVFYTAQGFIVFRLDNRGTDGRGRRFEDVIHRRTGGPEVRDQLTGVDWLKSQPYVDAERIVLQGWSYGGYMALMTLAQAPEGTFAAVVAGAPVTDWSLYDTFYTERYMGTPQDNPEGYAASSVFAHIDGLSRAPLMLVHGMADDNVTFDNTTRLMDALQQRGIVFELMTYPGQRHGIAGEARQVHLMRTRMEFLRRHIKTGER
ncbi:DPP IV N-terminal domain-containing protein [Hyphomonas sp.]|uniref:S9 family peptidase n=1 Tax=Hyphomonas sp. TaxID=87 RepID=UPI0039190AA8